MGPARPDVGDGCRYLPEGKHLIFYRVDDDTVVILAVLHASMDIERHIEPE
jgi:toxin ParE1/3/4